MKKITVILAALCFSLVSLAGNGKVNKVKTLKIKMGKEINKKPACARASFTWSYWSGETLVVGVCQTTQCSVSQEAAQNLANAVLYNGNCYQAHQNQH